MQYVIDASEKVHLIGPQYLPLHVTNEALAACEVIARLQGDFGEKDVSPESVDMWVQNNNLIVLPEIADLAIAVIDRILSGPSEALETWISDDSLKSWKANVVELKKQFSNLGLFISVLIDSCSRWICDKRLTSIKTLAARRLRDKA